MAAASRPTPGERASRAGVKRLVVASVGDAPARVGARLASRPGEAAGVGLVSLGADVAVVSAGISRRNPLLVIQAAVEPSRSEGALVQVRMRPPFEVEITGMVVIVLALVFAVAGGPMGLAALATLTLVSGLFTIGFAREARHVEISLREIFAAAPGKPTPVESGLPYR